MASESTAQATLTVRLPRDLRDRLAFEADATGQSLSAIVRQRLDKSRQQPRRQPYRMAAARLLRLCHELRAMSTEESTPTQQQLAELAALAQAALELLLGEHLDVVKNANTQNSESETAPPDSAGS